MSKKSGEFALGALTMLSNETKTHFPRSNLSFKSKVASLTIDISLFHGKL